MREQKCLLQYIHLTWNFRLYKSCRIKTIQLNSLTWSYLFYLLYLRVSSLHAMSDPAARWREMLHCTTDRILDDQLIHFNIFINYLIIILNTWFQFNISHISLNKNVIIMCAPCQRRMGSPWWVWFLSRFFYLLKSFFLATVATGLLTGGVVSNPVSLSGPCRPGFPKPQFASRWLFFY